MTLLDHRAVRWARMSCPPPMPVISAFLATATSSERGAISAFDEL